MRAVRDEVLTLINRYGRRYELLSTLGDYCDTLVEALAIYEEAFTLAEESNDLEEAFDIAQSALSAIEVEGIAPPDAHDWIFRAQRTAEFSHDSFSVKSCLRLIDTVKQLPCVNGF